MEGRWALFFDFASLHQHDGSSSGRRLPAEDALFKAALASLGTLFAHPYTTVFQLSQFPPDYPDGYEVPPGAHSAPYSERGWCFCECSWARAVKDNNRVLDISKFTGRTGRDGDYMATLTDCTVGRILAYPNRPQEKREAPVIPARFAALLEGKTFTNGTTDRPLVNRIYQEEFERTFGHVRHVNYAALNWGDEEAQALALVLEGGFAPRLESLDLSCNAIGDDGVHAITAAIRSGRAPMLGCIRFNDHTTRYQMYQNPASKSAVESLHAAVRANMAGTRAGQMEESEVRTSDEDAAAVAAGAAAMDSVADAQQMQIQANAREVEREAATVRYEEVPFDDEDSSEDSL